jgi:enediyne biosynthesis protein E4
MTSASTLCLGQGVSTRNVKPQPRGKPSGLPFLARFTDVAAQAGLVEPTIYGGLQHKNYIVEAVGCGIAFLDYDNDGWLDTFVLCGTRMDAPVPGSSNRLYKNNRDGTFTDVTESAGLLKTGWASGVTVGDYNNDGYEDIFITYYGQNVLYRNNGNGTFTDVTKQAGLLYEGNTRWGSGCTFLDYDRDGHLDLFIANYVELHLDKIPKPGANPYCNFKGVAVNCGPVVCLCRTATFTATRVTGHFRMSPKRVGLLERHGTDLFHDQRCRRLHWRRLDGHLCGIGFHSKPPHAQ